MAYRYTFTPACARDLSNLTRRDHRLLVRVVVDVIPAILQNPQSAGEKKRGELKDCYGFSLTTSGAAYRLVYAIEGEVVIFLSVGPHDAAYRDAARRL